MRKPKRLLRPCLVLGLSLLTALAAASPPGRLLGLRLFDTVLRLKPGKAAAPELLVLEAPKERRGAEELAAVIALLDEAEAGRAVLLEGSGGPAYLDPEEELSALRKELPAAIEREYADIDANVRAVFEGLRQGSIAPREAERYVETLASLVSASGERLRGLAAPSRSPARIRLGEEAGRFGKIFVGFGLEAPEGRRKEGGGAASGRKAGDASGQGIERFALPVRRLDAAPPPGASFGEPLFVEGAKGGGFSGLEPDRDGVLRRLRLVAEEDGRLYARAELAALADRLGGPELRLGRGRLEIRGAKFPGGKARNLVIPLDGEGRMLLDWPSLKQAGALRRLSAEDILAARRLEAELQALLEDLEREGLLVGEGGRLPSLLGYATRLRAESAPGDAEAALAWREAREKFFAEAAAYLDAYPEASFAAELAAAEPESGRSEAEQEALAERLRALYRGHAAARARLAALLPLRGRLLGELRSSFVFLPVSGGTEAPRTGRGERLAPEAAAALLAAQLMEGSAPRELPASASLALGLASALASSLFLLLRPRGGSRAAPGQAQREALGAAEKEALGAALGSGLGLALGCGAYLLARGAWLDPLPFALAPFGALAGSALAARLAARTGKPKAGAERRELVLLSIRAAGLSRGDEAAEPGWAEARAEAARAFFAAAEAAVRREGGTAQRAESGSLLARFADEKPSPGGAGSESGAPGAGEGPSESGSAAAEGLEPREGAARRALKAALAVAEACGRLDLELALKSGAGTAPAIDARVGVDSGPCLLSGSGREALVLGPAVDLAGRLADLNGHYGTRVLATGKTVEAAGSGFEARRMGDIRVEATGREAALYALALPGEEGGA